MTARLRVLVVEMPQLLRDIVEDSISGQPDMHLIAAPPHGPWSATDQDEIPDVIVTATTELEEARKVAVAWLRQLPSARVVIIETSGRRSAMYEILPSLTPLGELSPVQLVNVIRAAGRRVSPFAS